jgi:phosphoribosyl 1,2-cyclic phosphodiesterase
LLRFKNLGSGSAGNATLVEARDGLQVTRLLIDCGLRVSELERRLQAADLQLGDLDGLFVTHEHSDHVGHTQRFAQKTGLPVWMSEGTRLACQADEWAWAPGQLQVARDGVPIALGALELQPFTVPHDAREPLQLRCSDGDRSLGVLTDLGHASAHVVQALQGCHALLLEANHDTDMLSRSNYPAFLRKRIAGPLGHLSNADAAALLQAVRHPALNCVVAAHLSERNNTPALAQGAFCAVLGCLAEEVLVADPETGSDWHTA